MERVDLDDVADTIGVDPTSAREWAENLGGWLRGQAENLGDEVANRAGAGASSEPRAERAPSVKPTPTRTDPLSSAQPNPLDVPSEEQGVALAALDSGRWTVEVGTNRLTSQGEGPGPQDALGLVRELRVRDWITADGTITLAGRHALQRWLDATHG